MSKGKLIFSAVIAVIIIVVGLFIYGSINNVAVFKLFHREDRMERTATVLRSIKDTSRWIFLTVEDEEVVVRKHSFFEEDVAKIYPSYYELGIELDTKDWVEIQEDEARKVAILHLPPITIVNGGIDATEVINIYGNASDREKIEMQEEAKYELEKRINDFHLKQAKKNAEEHFWNLFVRVLGCDSVAFEWQ